jgi:hypothetical protein
MEQLDLKKTIHVFESILQKFTGKLTDLLFIGNVSSRPYMSGTRVSE